jgi:GNAT superfamily N-acetyltransferase
MAEINSLTEVQAGALATAKGHHVVGHGSRLWEQVKPGFYEPVHLLGALTEPDAWPTRVCWGYRAVVPPGTVTGSRLVVYLIDDVPGYDLEALTASRRHKLRRAQRSSIRLFPLTDDSLIQREGHAICLSAYRRFGARALPTAQHYARWMAAQDIGRRTSGIGATLDGRLIGYNLAHVIEGTAYFGDFHVETEALRTNVGTALSFELLALLRESGVVRSAWNGNVSPDDDGMTRFKTSMGYRCTALPTRLHLVPGAGVALRRWKPHGYERLTGRFAA